MTYTDTQLKQTLAKMLPDTLLWDSESAVHNTDRPQREAWGLCWDSGNPILDTELLHLCWLVWQTLDRKQRVAYSVYLREVIVLGGGHASSFAEDIAACCENATWQQRIIALAKVKGLFEL